MITFNHTCDKCKSTTETTNTGLPVGWAGIAYRIVRRCIDDWYINLELCPACANALNIPVGEDADIVKQTESIGDHLIEILTEIARSATDGGKGKK